MAGKEQSFSECEGSVENPIRRNYPGLGWAGKRIKLRIKQGRLKCPDCDPVMVCLMTEKSP